MEFRVLGALEAVGGGRRGAPTGAKERAVLACLLADPGRCVSAEALVAAAWPGQDPAAAARSLHVRIAHLRALLEPGRPRGAPPEVLVRDGTGYRLAVDPQRVDAVRFEAAVAEAAGLEPPLAVDAFTEALSLWRGPPFGDVAGVDLLEPRRRHLEELHARAAAGRAHALVALGRAGEALPELWRLAGEQPLSEELAAALAVALYRAGRQVDALQALRDLAGRLRELGLEPSGATVELERRILAHDPGLGAATPRAVPATGPAARLPRPRSRFFGREAQLDHAAALVSHGGLVTIAGVGGAGKTRLALELADRLPGPAWWCELASVRGEGDVETAVADALGLDTLDAAERLAALDGLLLLDNCEHVLDAAAAATERLLAGAPALRVVATSRAPLGVDGERLLRLAGLDLPAGAHAPDTAASPAVALFVDRMRAVRGTDGDRGEAALDTIAELCRRLDGLPLAIELAAGRTRSLTPAEIATRLHERLSLLAVSGRRAAARHSTLRAAVDWSYQLLDDAPRRLFERLSVFARGATLVDAEEVCCGDGVAREDVAALLDELVAHSLVTASTDRGTTHYGLLETLREYGAERLRDRGEEARWRDRHAERYVARARRLLTAGWREPRLPFVDEFADLRAAVRWTMAVDDTPDRAFLLVEGLWWMAHARHGEEIARLSEEALDHWPGDHPWRARALGAASVARMVTGDEAGARAHAEAAVALEARTGRPALLGRRTLAQIEFFRGEPLAALAAWRDLAERARSEGHPAMACEADGFAVQLLHAAGVTGVALTLAASMRDDADRLESPIMASWSRYVSGVVLLERDPDAAAAWLDEALSLARTADNHHMTRFSLRALGVAATLRGEHDTAARHLLAAIEHDERASDAASQRTTLLALAILVAERGDPETAAELLGAADGWPAAPWLRTMAAGAGERIGAGPEGALAEAVRRGRALDLDTAKTRARDALAG